MGEIPLFRSGHSGESRIRGGFFRWGRLSGHSGGNRRWGVISDSWRFYGFTVSKSKVCGWSVWIEALWMSRNRKLYGWAEIEGLWIIKLNRSFVDEQKPKVYGLSSWIGGFMDKSCQNRWFLAEGIKIGVIKEWYWLKRFSFEGFKIGVEGKRLNSSSW
jgi:hypothetical protein